MSEKYLICVSNVKEINNKGYSSIVD